MSASIVKALKTLLIFTVLYPHISSADPFTCPQHIETQQSLSQEQDGFDQYSRVVLNELLAVGFTDGHPDDKRLIKPGAEGSNGEPMYEFFTSRDIWMLCYYSNTEVLLKEGTLVDATIIEAPTSTKNKAGKRDPEMHQTKKGNQWHFGMKAHIGVDARTGITHSFTTTAANEHDLNQAHELLHGEEDFVFAEAGYRGAQKRSELQGGHAEWYIAEKPSRVKALKSHPRINKTLLNIEYIKASIRAKVEHPFRIIKCQFGFRKTNYRGLRKNHHKLAMLFALANIVRVDQMLRA
jgi:IS5 family transposase